MFLLRSSISQALLPSRVQHRLLSCAHEITSLLHPPGCACCPPPLAPIAPPYSTGAPASPPAQSDGVFEVIPVPWKFGSGAVHEIARDLQDLGASRVCLFTDENVASTDFFRSALSSLRHRHPSAEIVVYDRVAVEPCRDSILQAAQFLADLDKSPKTSPQALVSIGGGSAIDTLKAASLYAALPEPSRDFFAYLNAPIGAARPFPPPDAGRATLRPHIACPTTSGTGSETTCIAVCAIDSPDFGKTKTGLVHRALYPSLAVIDPDATRSLPAAVVASSGFDVLSHAIESFTARPFTARSPPFTPLGRRPLLQGKNPYADIGCREALRLCGKYLLRAVRDAGDAEARAQMSFASSIAGAAMGNAGTQLPHGLSYGVSGSVQGFFPDGYPESLKRGGKGGAARALVPHGMSVILHAPSVARYSNPWCGELQVEVLQLLGHKRALEGRVAKEEAGEHLAEYLIELMRQTGTPNGLRGLGFDDKDIPSLVEKAFPQKRVIDNAPFPVTKEIISELYEGSMTYW